MNMDKEKWIIFSVIGVGIGLMLFSAYRYYEHQERKEARRLEMEAKKAVATPPVSATKTKTANHQNNHVEVLGEYYLFRNDITAIVPYGAYNQLALWRYVRDKGQILPSNHQNCQNDDIQNSFEQTALGFRLQANRKYALAKQCYLLAAQKGNAYAANRLGELYLLGLGVQKDLEQAKLWLEQSANTGYYFAEFNLGLMYLDAPLTSKTLEIDPIYSILVNKDKLKYMKIGTNADLEKAKYWFSRSYRQNGGEPRIVMQHFRIPLYTGEIENLKIDVDFKSKINHQTYHIKSENLFNRYPTSDKERNDLHQIVFVNKNGVLHSYPKNNVKHNLP